MLRCPGNILRHYVAEDSSNGQVKSRQIFAAASPAFLLKGSRGVLFGPSPAAGATGASGSPGRTGERKEAERREEAPFHTAGSWKLPGNGWG